MRESGRIVPGMLIVHEHPHVLEYHREYGKGYREHVYTEHVDDQGFVFQHVPALRAAWLARYTRVCADDYLTRVGAAHGRWLVHVYRTGGDERRHLVSVRMHWPFTEAETETGSPGRVRFPTRRKDTQRDRD